MKCIIRIILVAQLLYPGLQMAHAEVASPQGPQQQIFDDALIFAKDGKLEAAREKFIIYLKAEPNVVRSINGMGTTYMANQDYASALPFYVVGYSLGSGDALKYLVICSLKLHQLETVAQVLEPLKMLAGKNAEMAALLFAYAMQANNPDLVKYSMGLIPDEYLRSNVELLNGIIAACEQFHLDDQKTKYVAMREKLTAKSGAVPNDPGTGISP